jgi:hypothetical protein
MRFSSGILRLQRFAVPEKVLAELNEPTWVHFSPLEKGTRTIDVGITRISDI